MAPERVTDGFNDDRETGTIKRMVTKRFGRLGYDSKKHVRGSSSAGSSFG